MTDDDTAIRLAKRVAELLCCSRREAELYIEGGWVQVDGRVVEEPPARVRSGQAVTVAPGARPQPIPPATLLWNHRAGDPIALPADGPQGGPQRVLRRQLAGQECVAPLERAASGLVVFTQDHRIGRRLVEEAALVEHEFNAEVRGRPSDAALRDLAMGARSLGCTACKASVSSHGDDVSGLRLAVKGWSGGLRAERWFRDAGLQLLALRRIRIGRIPLAGLEPGRWRFLAAHERF
ncbi:RNA pseudouridine synthase [Xylophilus sp.]|uniref:RNA pseudouridine synthase n=1 Tax=Xylophilus sp. TaxID=2653893 RepID=UPI0013BD16E9|nr:RNA pseudouridine synthase [Xylophilus sp.]KAF1048984.1 MAG: Ribosomal large subunit pseudouridine synthase B [Xylophilus sp.]